MNVWRNGRAVKLTVNNGQAYIEEGDKLRKLPADEAAQILGELEQFYLQKSIAVGDMLKLLVSSVPEPTDVRIEFLPEKKVTRKEMDDMVLKLPTKLGRTRIRAVNAGVEYQI